MTILSNYSNETEVKTCNLRDRTSNPTISHPAHSSRFHDGSGRWCGLFSLYGHLPVCKIWLAQRRVTNQLQYPIHFSGKKFRREKLIRLFFRAVKHTVVLQEQFSIRLMVRC